MRRLLVTGLLSTVTLVGTLNGLSAAPPVRTAGFPEQKAYCQPALEIMNQYWDGVLTRKLTVLETARVQIEKCRTTNKLGAHLSAAQVESLFGNPQLAVTEARAAVALAPLESEAHRRLCMLLPTGAEKNSVCEGMRRFASQNFLINFTLGQQAIGAKNYSAGIRLMDDVIALRPDYGGAWLERGLAKWRSGNATAGLADLDRSLALLPLTSLDGQTAITKKHELLTSLNRHSDAAKALDQHVAAFPKDGYWRLLRGESYLKAAQYKSAALECSTASKSEMNYELQTRAEKCVTSARFSNAGDAQRKRDCSRFFNFGGKTYEVSASHYDGKAYANFPTMTLVDRKAGNANVEVSIGLDGQTETYSDRYSIYIRLDTTPYQSSEERQMRARALEIGWYGDLGKKFPHMIHGELVAQNGAKATFSADATAYFFDMPSGKAVVSSATPEQQHFGPAAMADKRFRLRVWYTSTGALVADEDIFLPTDLDQRLVQMKAAAAQLKASATPGWC